jgi:hypothetical protein
MNDILFYHKIAPTTWVYLSSLLMIGLFFKFSRLWSIRNLDLVLLILLAPGLLLVDRGIGQSSAGIEQIGYLWLFSITGIFLIRMLLDPMMVRRPLLEPNLSVGGMTFIGISLLVFLMANVVNSKVTREDLAAAQGIAPSSQVAADQQTDSATTDNASSNSETEFVDESLSDSGLPFDPVAPSSDEKRPIPPSPGYPLLRKLPPIPTQVFLPRDLSRQPGQGTNVAAIATARTLAVVSHVMIILGIVLIGYRHFDNIRTGIAAALLYLLLPYTAQLTGRVDHALPAALLVWAIEAYRRPFSAGVFMGLAIGTAYYPLFLLPLWISFYWQRGFMRFGLGVLAALAVMIVALFATSENGAMFWEQLKQMFGWPALTAGSAEGFWSFDFIDPVYRIPVVAAFLALSASFALWPAQKNLGTLMSCSAAIMLAAQVWNANGGGLYMGWYLPLVLLTIFRPNLEDRVALSVLGEGWRSRKRPTVVGAERAA